MTLDYLRSIPDGPDPLGRVIVHNFVRRPSEEEIRELAELFGEDELGHRGFRAWWAEPAGDVVPCDCGWRPELGVHYRKVYGEP